MCFTVAQYQKVAQARMRYWNARNSAAAAQTEEQYVASAFEHPSLTIVRSDGGVLIDVARWGLIPGWCRSESEALQLSVHTLNAKGETIFDKPSFRDAALHSRCLIPVNGFFEHQHSGKSRIPYYMSMDDEPVFSLGGLCSEWCSSSGEIVRTFTIVTTEANALMEVIHNSKRRMPLILDRADEQQWLEGSPQEARSLVVPSASRHLRAWRVRPFLVKGRAVNNPSALQPDLPNLLF